MAFRLYIMRHGDALMNAPRDSLRPLSQRGHEQAKDSALYLKSKLLEYNSVNVLLASPYLRAQETSENVIECLGYTGEVISCDSITPNDSPNDVIKMLSTYESKGVVLMISHQPLVSALIGRLVSGNEYEGIPMGTATIACLEMPSLGVGMAELLWVRHSER